MTRGELKEQIDELMRQYADEEIDGARYHPQHSTGTALRWGGPVNRF